MKKLGLAIGVAAALTGCSGGKKIDMAKLQAIHKIAVVSVCTSYTLATGRRDVDATMGEPLVPYFAKGLSSALPKDWTGVQIVPFEQVAARADIPKDHHEDNHACAAGLDGFAKGKWAPGPDKALMMQLAKTLDVDAVLGVWSIPTLKLTSSKTYLWNATSAMAYIVDKDGNMIAKVATKDPESTQVEGLVKMGWTGTDITQASPEQLEKLGTSYGESMAQFFANKLMDK